MALSIITVTHEQKIEGDCDGTCPWSCVTEHPWSFVKTYPWNVVLCSVYIYLCIIVISSITIEFKELMTSSWNCTVANAILVCNVQRNCTMDICDCKTPIDVSNSSNVNENMLYYNCIRIFLSNEMYGVVLVRELPVKNNDCDHID